MTDTRTPSAFPHPSYSFPHEAGMTLRDWFAGMALSSFAGSMSLPQANAKQAYQIVDAMLAERAKGCGL